MEQEILKMAASQGLWAVLFVALLFWVLRENAKREANYQQLLQDLTNKFGILEDVKTEVNKISNKIFGGVQ
ncbi:MAG TPA: bacteriocin [Thermoanaerobacterales bacterium]|nr:bacteriocin [Thermoanaerobacterales bacterium]